MIAALIVLLGANILDVIRTIIQKIKLKRELKKQADEAAL
jgi:hypothetical protein